MVLSAAADRKRSPRHVAEILDNMTDIFTAVAGIILGAEYANRYDSNERRTTAHRRWQYAPGVIVWRPNGRQAPSKRSRAFVIDTARRGGPTGVTAI